MSNRVNITSAKFVKGLVEADEILEDGIPQVAFVGRSNVGKSSVINSLANKKNLAKTSSFPGRTREINIFLISTIRGSSSGENNSFYLVDLPGYGFAKGSKGEQEKIQSLIYWYLLASHYQQKKVVLIIDAELGATNTDIQMLHSLTEQNKQIIIVANKVDKIKKSVYKKQLNELQGQIGNYKVIPYSAEKRIGVSELTNEILK
jgi:GTP-binding protein